jgi:hypothetical protein
VLGLAALDMARVVDDMAVPGFRLDALKGTERGQARQRLNLNAVTKVKLKAA